MQRYAGTWVPRNAYLSCPEHVVQARGLGEEVLYTRVVDVEVLPGENLGRRLILAFLPSWEGTRPRTRYPTKWFSFYVPFLWCIRVCRHHKNIVVRSQEHPNCDKCLLIMTTTWSSLCRHNFVLADAYLPWAWYRRKYLL